MIARWSPTALAAALSYVCGLSPHAPPANLYAALSSTPFGVDGADFAELAVGGYARRLVPLTLADASADPDEGRSVSSTAEVSFGALAEAGTYQGVGLFDSLLGGTVWFWADLDIEVAFDAGQAVRLPAGLIRIGLRLR